MYIMNDNVNRKNMKECGLFSASSYGRDVKVTDYFSWLEEICVFCLFFFFFSFLFSVQRSLERPHCWGDGDFQRGHYFLDGGRRGG